MLVTCLIALLLASEAAESADRCQTPNGQDGDCKPINQCPPIYSLFEQRPISSTTATFLRKSHCGLEGIYPKVCCAVGSSFPSRPNLAEKRKLLPEVCGNSLQKRIVGGEVAGLDEFPWMALLEYQLSGNRTSFGCGGSLISKRYVLTARHCAKENLINVRLGEYDTRTDPDCIKSRFGGEDCSYKVLNIPIEEKISYSGDGDIALLRLSRDVEFTDFVKPICLPFGVDELISSGEKLFVAGWGLTEKKQPSSVKLKVVVPIKPPNDCTIALKTVFNVNYVLHDGELCAGGEEGKDSCNGDSGGPLMGIKFDQHRNLEWYVMGVVSFGPTNPCGRRDKPAVYVKVSKYVDWILQNLKP